MKDGLKTGFNNASNLVDKKQPQGRGMVDQPLDREAFERDRRIHQTPVSKIELEARKRLRALPKLVLEPTPDGTINRSDNSREHSENERRIHFLEKRLERIAGQVKDQFDKKR